MALSKLAISLIASSIGVVAITATVAGVVVSRENNVQTVDTNKKETTTKPTKPTNLPQDNNLAADEAFSTDQTLFDIALKNINKESFVFVNSKSDNQEKDIKDYYAFNIKDENLKIAKKANLPKEIQSEINIKTQSIDFEKLNKGILNVTVKLIHTSNQTSISKDFEITGFKPGEESLKTLLDASGVDNEQTSKKQSLTITPSSDKANEFVTVEELNKQETKELNGSSITVSGLSNWLNKSTFSTTAEKLKDVYIQAEVKLARVEKDNNNKTLFVFESANKNQYLKLIKKTGNEVAKELVLSEIKTSNVLASDITLFPIDKNETKAKEFVDNLEKQTGDNKEFDKTNKDTSLKRNLSIKVPKDKADSTSQVFIKPYALVNKKDETNILVKLGLSISFGNGKNIKTYKTTNENDIKELSEANFSFHIYSKNLADKKDMNISASDLTNESLKLSSYFKQENYKIPAAKPIIQSDDDSGTNENKNNGFNVSMQLKEEIKNPYSLTLKKEEASQNIILFADYSYTSAATQNKLENMVLYTPSLSLVHIEIKSEE